MEMEGEEEVTMIGSGGGEKVVIKNKSLGPSLLKA